MNKIAVIGLGYVGLPVALAFARHFPHTIGFDINARKVEQLQSGRDATGEVGEEALRQTSLKMTACVDDLRGANFFVVAVPTPIDASKRPDLKPLMDASEIVGTALTPGAVVVYESTVFPGATEEVCGPILERVSGLTQGKDFKLGYSPERLNPGDQDHTLEKIVKVVAGEDDATLARVAAAYEEIIPVGIHRAPSIRVAETAKVMENTQRDLNIALMNELAIICDHLGIRTRDVLAAARTKWNFLGFSPGLVGGHCIGVDPYYLTNKAEEIGYHPEVILAGRRINDNMGRYVAQKLVRMLIQADVSVRSARVGIFGLTFKENVADLRNSRVADIIAELRVFGIEPMVHDPLADAEEAQAEYGVHLTPWNEMTELDGAILAVNHRWYLEQPAGALPEQIRPGGALVDIKSALDPETLPTNLRYWCL